jgi:hypothetical protein
MTIPSDAQVKALELELEKAEHGLGMPYDRERARELRQMLVEPGGGSCLKGSGGAEEMTEDGDRDQHLRRAVRNPGSWRAALVPRLQGHRYRIG